MKTILATLIACAWAICAGAQTPATVAPAPSTPATPAAVLPVGVQAPAAQVASPADCCRILAETAVVVEIAEPLNSSKLHRGDYFALRLAEPVMLDGNVVIPAGTTGVGQVVDASAARSGGAPGKLVLAARHLDYAGQQLQLHALKLGARGRDNSGLAMGASVGLGVFAMFIHGGQVEIPTGTRADAKLAPNVVPPSIPAPSSPAADIPQQEH